MLRQLLAYDADGNIIATLDSLVARDDDGTVVGLVDFEAHESAGGKLRDVWDVAGAAGSATWPEWLGARARDFRAELDADKRIVALVHRSSGHRRERAPIEVALEDVMARPSPGDARVIVGGPDRPLRLDAEGRTVAPAKVPPRRMLPAVGRQSGRRHAVVVPEDRPDGRERL